MRKIFWFSLIVLLVACPLALAQDPGLPDTLWLERIDSLSANDTVTYHISFWTDSKLNGITVPITFYNQNNQDINLDTNSFAWSVDISPYDNKFRNVDNVNKKANFSAFFIDSSYWVSPGKHELASFNFISGANWHSDISVSIDTTFYLPTHRVKFVDSIGNNYIPTVIVQGYIITPPPSDFTLNVSPDSGIVQVGSATIYNLSLTSISNWNLPCTLSVVGLPSGANSLFAPGVVIPPGSSALYITASVATPPGDYTLTVSARNGGKVRSQDVSLTVQLKPDFTLTVYPDTQEVEAGDSVQFSLFVDSLYGFNSEINLDIDPIPPQATYIFSPSPLVPPDSSILTIHTQPTTPVGDYTVTIIAYCLGTEHTKNVVLQVKPPQEVKDETGNKAKPTEFTLFQNYPNPFNLSTKIEFTLPSSGFVNLNIYDILGKRIRTLVSENLSSGYKSVFWEGKDDWGKEVSSGIYLYKLKVENFSETKKLVLLK